MRTLTVILLALVCGAGCGQSGPSDNAHLQTPSDQPLDAPQLIGGPPAHLASARPVKLDMSSTRVKPLPLIEVQQ